MPDRPEWYANREEKYSRIVHCEINALMQAAIPVIGFTLYTWPFACCDRCAVQMIQAGITRFVYPDLPENLRDRWAEPLRKTVEYFKECGVQFTEIDRDRVESGPFISVG